MNGSRAKKIRRKVYGDFSQKEERNYITVQGARVNHPDSLRAQYYRAKKEYNKKGA